jgi:alpha-tubulin suppressor-like RCC1 family protein
VYSPIATEFANAVQVSAAEGITCIRRNDGTVACAGTELGGALGLGDIHEALSPTDIPGLDAIDLANGYRSTCAVRTDGSVACWGDNDLGQLGTGAPAPTIDPVVQGCP